MFEQLREDIRCIHERDPAARSRLEILTCYPGLHAILIHRLANRLWRRGWLWAGRFLSHLGRLSTGIEIHPGAHIGRRVFIDHGFGVVIGETAEVGDDCTIYQGVTLGGTRLYKGEKRHPTLEEGVVVGAGAQILGGFVVGAHARVGSNAVVIKPVPAGATAVGNPARIIEREPPKPSAAATDAPADTAVSTPGQSGDDIPSPDGKAPAGSAQAPAATPARKSGLPPRPVAEGGGPDTDPADAGRAGRRGHGHQRPTPEPALPCQTEWTAEPLRDLLQRGRQDADPSTDTDDEEFAAYGVARGDDDPLVKVLHELINHTAEQDMRIHRLCKAMEDLGQRVENGVQPLDTDRLNRMVE